MNSEPLVKVFQKIRLSNQLIIILISILGIWAISILPSVFFNEWFPLDMGDVFTIAKGFSRNVEWILSPYKSGSGRYFPIYWLYNVLAFWLFGTGIAMHYLVQSVMFLASLLIACYIFYKVSKNLNITLFLGLLIPLSTPNAENLYTLGKAEPLTFFFVIILLLVFYTAISNKTSLRIVSFVTISCLFALAIWTKETALVLLVFCPIGISVALLLRVLKVRVIDNKVYLFRYLSLFCSLILGLLISRLPYFLFKKTYTSHYTDYKVTLELITENLIFYISNQPDIVFFGILSTVFIAVIIRKLKLKAIDFDAKAEFDLIFSVSLLFMAWSYCLVFLIWRWPMGYYLYLPSIIFKLTTAYGLYIVIQNRLFSKFKLTRLYSLMSLFLIYTISYFFYVAASQISYSKMYTEVVNKYVKDSKKENRLVLESYPFFAEQISTTGRIISLISGEDRVVAGIGDLVNPAMVTHDLTKLLNVSKKDLDDNEKKLPEKDDYLMLMTGNKLATWFVRGVTPYFSDDSILKKDGAYDMELVAENKAYNSGIFMNVWTYKINVGPTYIGYKLYKINSGPKITWIGRYPGGWIGKSALLKIYPEYGEKALVHVSTPNFNPQNRLLIFENDVLLNDVLLTDGREYTFELINSKKHKPNIFRFEVEKTTVPKKIKLNKDTRELGILVRLEHLR